MHSQKKKEWSKTLIKSASNNIFLENSSLQKVSLLIFLIQLLTYDPNQSTYQGLEKSRIDQISWTEICK